MTPAVDWGLTKSIAGKQLSYVLVLHRRTKLNFIWSVHFHTASAESQEIF